MTNNILTRAQLLDFLILSQNCQHNAAFLYVLIDEVSDGFHIRIDTSNGTIASSVISPEMCACVVGLGVTEPQLAAEFAMGLTDLVPTFLRDYPETPCNEHEVLKAIDEWASVFCGVHDEDAILSFCKYKDYGEVALSNKAAEYRYEFMVPKNMFGRMDLALPKVRKFSEATNAIKTAMRPYKIDDLLQDQT